MHIHRALAACVEVFWARLTVRAYVYDSFCEPLLFPVSSRLRSRRERSVFWDAVPSVYPLEETRSVCSAVAQLENM